MLGHRVDVGAFGLAVPARDARQAVRDVLDLDVERRGVEQIEPAARQHALPGARRCRPLGFRRGAWLAHVMRLASLVHSEWRWQVTRWSLTMPTACMKA